VSGLAEEPISSFLADLGHDGGCLLLDQRSDDILSVCGCLCIQSGVGTGEVLPAAFMWYSRSMSLLALTPLERVAACDAAAVAVEAAIAPLTLLVKPTIGIILAMLEAFLRKPMPPACFFWLRLL
jgi:hypothetical protein